jgi:hypothetical protein
MAGSEVEIVNVALSRIGHTDLLEDTGVDLEALEDGTDNPALEQAILHYARQRDAVLRRFPWPFATLREKLVELPDERRSDWEHAFAVPTDSLAVREVLVPGLRNPRPDQRVAHRIEARRGAPDSKGMRPVIGQVILCDEDAIEIRHTVRVLNPAAFPVDFDGALATALAAQFASSLVKGDEGRRLRLECLGEHEVYVRNAFTAARLEENPDQEPDGSFLSARR